MIGTAAMWSMEENEDAEDDIEALHRTSATFALLGVLGGGGMLISSRAPSRDAAASFRLCVDAYNPELRRRLGLIGPVQ